MTRRNSFSIPTYFSLYHASYLENGHRSDTKRSIVDRTELPETHKSSRAFEYASDEDGQRTSDGLQACHRRIFRIATD